MAPNDLRSVALVKKIRIETVIKALLRLSMSRNTYVDLHDFKGF